MITFLFVKKIDYFSRVYFNTTMIIFSGRTYIIEIALSAIDNTRANNKKKLYKYGKGCKSYSPKSWHIERKKIYK